MKTNFDNNPLKTSPTANIFAMSGLILVMLYALTFLILDYNIVLFDYILAINIITYAYILIFFCIEKFEKFKIEKEIFTENRPYSIVFYIGFLLNTVLFFILLVWFCKINISAFFPNLIY